MTGANWETMPAGRPGWQMFFLHAGFDVFVSDAVERGRALWNTRYMDAALSHLRSQGAELKPEDVAED
jgi:hypothetical protein